MLKKLHLKSFLLLFALIVGVGNAWGDTSTLTLSSSKKFGTTSGSTLTDSEGSITWTCVGSNIQNTYITDYSGQQFGTSKTNNVFTFTANFSGKVVTNVVIRAAAGSTTPTYDISVGGSSWKSGNLSKTSTSYSAAGSGTGNVVITLNQNSAGKAVYLGSITVTYTTGGGSTVFSPVITPEEGTYNNVQSVSMSCETDGATIYYTTDGSTPSTSSNVYSAPFEMTTAGTVKAYAVKDGIESSVASATYTYKVADPVFSVAAGTIIAPQNVTITTETADATIYYTTDGSTPDINSTAYPGPIHVEANTTIKAIAMKDGFTSSAVETATYTFFAINAKNINSGYFEKVTDASKLEEGDCILIVNESAGMAMSTTQNENNRGIKAITLTDGTTYAPAAEVQKLILKKVTENENEYFYFYTGTGFLFAASSSKNYLRTQTTIDNNAKASISISSSSGNATIEFQGSNSHNLIQYNSGSSIFSCYANAQQNIQIYKEVAKNVPVTITEAGYATNCSAYFATYCSAYALDFSGVSELTAYIATVSDNTVSFNAVDDVPANTGVLVKGTAAAKYNVPVVASSRTDVRGNALVGVTAETKIGKKTDNNFNYVLKDGKDGVGFYQVNNDNYRVRANSAYLAISYDAAQAGAKLFIGLDGETAVEAVAAEVLPTGTAYNLQGQRVGNDYKGVVIVNGKKVIR